METWWDFVDVPVYVDYPDVSLSVPADASGRGAFTFAGRFQSNGTLTGRWTNGSSGYDMSLSRGGNYCGL